MEVNYPWPQDAPQQPAPLYNKLIERGREGKNDWWRYCVGILLSFVVGYQIIGAIPLVVLLLRGLAIKAFTVSELLQDSTKMLNPDFLHVSKNTMLFALMFLFVGAMLGLWFAVRVLHRKPMMAVISGVSNKFDFKRYFFAFAIWISICAIQLFLALQLSPETFHLVFEPVPFFIGVAILLVLLPIQTGWEEIFMRGYLMQALGVWMKKSLWPWIITSVVFGLLHIMNAEVQMNGVLKMLPLYILPGLIFGAIALMDERLELPMGMHLAHNLFGLLTISSRDSSIQTYSIWEVESIAGTTTDAIFGSVMMIGVVFVLYYVYRWDFKKLYK